MRSTVTAAGIVCALLLSGGGRAVRAQVTQGAAAPAAPDATLLEAGQAIERQLSPHQEHVFRLVMTKDEHVRVIVDQRGITVSAQARDAQGRVLADFVDEARQTGDLDVEIVSGEAGTYSLRLASVGTAPVPGSYAVRIAERRASTDAERSLQALRALRSEATRFEAQARYAEARTLFERALAGAEALRGPDDALAITLVRDLAGNALELRDDAKAESLYSRALAWYETTRGSESADAAVVRSRLGLLASRAGQRPKAEAQLQQALDVLEHTVGTAHQWYLRTLVTLATVRDDGGDLDSAEEIDLRAMATLERVGATDTILYAGLLNNLGDVYRQKGDFTRAEDLFRRSLAMNERLTGPDSYYVGVALQNLGIVARERKDYATAQAHYTRALAIRERIVGADHPDVAQLLVNLGNLYRAMGDNTRSLESQVAALRIFERHAGDYGRGTLVAVGNIARTYAAMGDLPEAIAFQRRTDAVIETQLALNLAVGSERQKLAFMDSLSDRTDRTISLSLHQAPHDAGASSLAALVVLQRKGRVQDAMTDALASVRQHVTNARDQGVLDQLRTTTAQLARVALSSRDDTRPADRASAIKNLEASKERLEAELSGRSAEFRAHLRSVTLEAVQAAIPDGAALVEFVVYRPFAPAALRNAEAYGAPHYGAFVLARHGAPRGYDLGAAEAIDKAIDALRQALRDPARADVTQRARDVDARVVEPLRASIGDATRLLVSPDGDLNLVPFEALMDARGHYRVERYAISYLTSGRDLLRMYVTHTPKREAVIVADPLFGEPAADVAEPNAPPAAAKARALTQRRNVTVGDDASTLYFAPLWASAEEARTIKALFPEAILLTGRDATQSRIEREEAPRILHIASHGFFLDDAGHGASGGVARGGRASALAANPLLRSGLALAGANLSDDPHGDGILTALEASTLNLWGTKLVTLSACDTGVGEVRIGEGVYGLRRAFVLAGAETLVMSLWPVSDYVSHDTMRAYYTGLRAGLGRGAALRQAKLAMLKRKGRQHPFYWASFIQSGEWASLDGRR